MTIPPGIGGSVLKDAVAARAAAARDMAIAIGARVLSSFLSLFIDERVADRLPSQRELANVVLSQARDRSSGKLEEGCFYINAMGAAQGFDPGFASA